jgi:hypothetical protein
MLSAWKSAAAVLNRIMFSSSQLTEDQKAALFQWAEQGDTIADLQRKLREEYELKITYMDARFLVLDLGITIRDESEEKAADAGPEEVVIDATPEPTGGVHVSMDSIAVPGALISGKVTFSDGEKAVWMIDQTGRPGLDPDTPGYRPSQEDIEAFQVQLSELVKDSGM